jgi:hypothetical protein
MLDDLLNVDEICNGVNIFFGFAQYNDFFANQYTITGGDPGAGLNTL